MPDGKREAREFAHIVAVERPMRTLLIVAVDTPTGKRYVLADRITDLDFEIDLARMTMIYGVTIVRTASGISGFGELERLEGSLSFDGVLRKVFRWAFKNKENYIGTAGKYVRWTDFYPLFGEDLRKRVNDVVGNIYSLAMWNWVVSTGKYNGEQIDVAIFDIADNLEDAVIASADAVFSRLIDEGYGVEF